MIHLEEHGPVTTIRMARSFLGRPVYWTAAYWVDGLLVDSGPPCTANELVRSLRGRSVEQVVITHAHEDHIGGLARLRRAFPDAGIYAPRRALAFIADPPLLCLPLYRRLLWGRPEAAQGVRSLDEIDDRVATSTYEFRVVETPGHTPDHISLFEPSHRWLFAGDAFIGGEDRAWPAGYDLFAVVSSLRTLASLRPERMFPGSGHVRRTPQPDIHAKIGGFMHLADAVAKGTATGASTGELATALLGNDARVRFWTGGRFSAANLIDACKEYNALLDVFEDAAPTYADDAPDDGTERPYSPPPSRSTDLTI